MSIKLLYMYELTLIHVKNILSLKKSENGLFHTYLIINNTKFYIIKVKISDNMHILKKQKHVTFFKEDF